VIVTKDASRTARIYTPTGPLQPDAASAVPVQRVGIFSPERTGKPNVLGTVGQLVVTGGGHHTGGHA
jgi:hypothetical protein